MEVTILKKSQIKAENTTYRIDAEFFQKKYLDAVSQIEKHKYSYIEDITSWVTQGPNPVFCEFGIPCLTGRNINGGEVSYINPDYVDESEYFNLSRFQLKTGDTLITLKGKGSIGKIGYVTNNRRAIFSRDIGVVRPKNIDPGYLNVFILCKYGKLLVDRGETGGTGQSTLTTSYLKFIPVPRFDFEKRIGVILDNVENLKTLSSEKYQEAQTLVLSELNLSDCNPAHQLTFVKQFSDTKYFSRIDAEYFQPKYDELIEIIRAYPNSWDTFGNLLTIEDSNFEPLEKAEYQYIELSNIGSNGEISDCMLADGCDLPTRARRKVKTGDIIVSSIEGSLDSIALVNEDYDQALCSTGFYAVNSQHYLPEVLLVLLKSLVGQMQLKKGCSGTILSAINKDEFKQIILPIIPQDVQQQIQQKIIEAFNLRKQSKQLLECAKRVVEIAIEENEAAALDYLNREVGNATNL